MKLDYNVRKRLDELFSREVLGSVFVSLSVGKVIEHFIKIGLGSNVTRLIGWIVATFLFIVMYIYWERVERRVEEGVEKAEESVEE